MPSTFTAPVGALLLLAGGVGTAGLGAMQYGTANVGEVAALPGSNRPYFVWLICLAVLLCLLASGLAAVASGLADTPVTRQWAAAVLTSAAVGTAGVLAQLAVRTANVEIALSRGADRTLTELEFAANQLGHTGLMLAFFALLGLAAARGGDGLLAAAAALAGFVLLVVIVIGAGVPLLVTGVAAAVVGGCSLGSPGLRRVATTTQAPDRMP